MTDPGWKMIWPPVWAEAAVLQLPLMLDPELKMIVPLVSARPPMLPPLKGLIVTLLVVIWALVVAWTAGDPLSVVLTAIVQAPAPSVTELPEIVQLAASAMSTRPWTLSRARAATAVLEGQRQ